MSRRNSLTLNYNATVFFLKLIPHKKSTETLFLFAVAIEALLSCSEHR